METLLCSTCKQMLPTTEFVRRPNTRRGYQSACKTCLAQRHQRTKAIPLEERIIPKAKRCGACGELKKITAFNVLKRNPDGHHSQCRDCVQRQLGSTPMQQPLYWLAGPAGIEPGAFCTS